MADSKDILLRIITAYQGGGVEALAAALQTLEAEGTKVDEVLGELEAQSQEAALALEEVVQAVEAGELGEVATAIDQATVALEAQTDAAAALADQTQATAEEVAEAADGDRVAEIAKRQHAQATADAAAHLAEFGGRLAAAGRRVAEFNPELGRSMERIGEWTQRLASAAGAIALGFAAGGPIGAALAGLGVTINTAFQSWAAQSEAAARAEEDRAGRVAAAFAKSSAAAQEASRVRQAAAAAAAEEALERELAVIQRQARVERTRIEAQQARMKLDAEGARIAVERARVSGEISEEEAKRRQAAIDVQEDTLDNAVEAAKAASEYDSLGQQIQVLEDRWRQATSAAHEFVAANQQALATTGPVEISQAGLEAAGAALDAQAQALRQEAASRAEALETDQIGKLIEFLQALNGSREDRDFFGDHPMLAALLDRLEAIRGDNGPIAGNLEPNEAAEAIEVLGQLPAELRDWLEQASREVSAVDRVVYPDLANATGYFGQLDLLTPDAREQTERVRDLAAAAARAKDEAEALAASLGQAQDGIDRVYRPGGLSDQRRDEVSAEQERQAQAQQRGEQAAARAELAAQTRQAEAAAREAQEAAASQQRADEESRRQEAATQAQQQAAAQRQAAVGEFQGTGAGLVAELAPLLAEAQRQGQRQVVGSIEQALAAAAERGTTQAEARALVSAIERGLATVRGDFGTLLSTTERAVGGLVETTHRVRVLEAQVKDILDRERYQR